MSHDETSRTDRRTFLQASALSTAATINLVPGCQAEEAPVQETELPRRPLGKTGVSVTIINQGTWRASGLDRLLRLSYASGIRCYDTAGSYRTEPNFKSHRKE